MFSNKKPANNAYHRVSGFPVDSNYLLLLEIEKTLQGIRLARESLSVTPLAKGKSEYVRPIECDQIADISTEIKEGITKISGKLRSIDKLLAYSYADHYLLLLRLHAAQTKSTELNKLLMRYRSICTENTVKQNSALPSVQREMSIFIQTCEQIEVETDNLLDSMLLNNTSTRIDETLGL